MQQQYKNPFVTVDIIIEINGNIVLIERANPPYGWALPGGFVDYGETLETSAVREAKEETSLDIKLKEQFHTYSDPKRDPRHHTVTTVFIAQGIGIPTPADDAKNVGVFTKNKLPNPIVFDHEKIIQDYFRYREGELIKDWIKQANKTDIIQVLKELFNQLFVLDQLKANKEEMHHPWKHVIIKDNKPVLIDFERMHISQDPKNISSTRKK